MFVVGAFTPEGDDFLVLGSHLTRGVYKATAGMQTTRGRPRLVRGLGIIGASPVLSKSGDRKYPG